MRGCTSIGWCKLCDKPFEKIGKGTGSRKYCVTDSKNAKRKSNKKYEHNTRIPNRDKEARNEYERNRISNRSGVRKRKPGTFDNVGKPNPNWIDKEWMIYHSKIKRMHFHLLFP